MTADMPYLSYPLRLQVAKNVHGADWALDGKSLAYSTNASVWLVSLVNGVQALQSDHIQAHQIHVDNPDCEFLLSRRNMQESTMQRACNHATMHLCTCCANIIMQMTHAPSLSMSHI